MNKEKILSRLKKGLIVSCQALENEPLHSSFIMSRMAYAACVGGASGIRSNSAEDVRAIKELVDLPVIGIKKNCYPGCDVFITPTMREIDEMAVSGAEIIAFDATKRERPDGRDIGDLYREVRSKYPDLLFMADISDYEEGKKAYDLGFDLISTTLCSYTAYTAGQQLPNYDLISRLSELPGIVLVAEGGIWTPDELKHVLDLGAYAAVVGTAITRPREITKRFVDAINS